MFPACPAEMLLTLWLKTGRLPVLIGSAQVRLAKFTIDRFKYSRFVCKACRVVVSRYLTTTGRKVVPDKTVTV